jgi:hypothetical protein
MARKPKEVVETLLGSIQDPEVVPRCGDGGKGSKQGCGERQKQSS